MPHLTQTALESRELAVSLTLIIACIATAYLWGWLQLRSTSFNSVPLWRATSFILGLLLTWVGVASPMASFDEKMLTGHMTQHLLLMTFAPPLIWLGAPVMSFLYVLPAARRLFRRRAMQELGRVLGHPAFCWLAAAAALVAWHVPALFQMGMQSQVWHLVEHASFFAT